jgi:hypothetical protein
MTGGEVLQFESIHLRRPYRHCLFGHEILVFRPRAATWTNLALFARHRPVAHSFKTQRSVQ